MNLSISHAGDALRPCASTLNASDAPARNTNVGAQMCVIQRVKNSPAGSAAVIASGYIAESSGSWVPSNAIDAWSTTISTMTSPRIQSIAAMRAERTGAAAAAVHTPLSPADLKIASRSASVSLSPKWPLPLSAVWVPIDLAAAKSFTTFPLRQRG